VPLQYCSRQPSCPQLHFFPKGYNIVCPISPALQFFPLIKVLFSNTAPAIPVPNVKQINDCVFSARPIHFSPIPAQFTSLSTNTGILNSFSNIFFKFTPVQFGRLLVA